MHDLEPYLCTFAECEDSARTYVYRASWLEHEITSHRSRLPLGPKEERTTCSLTIERIICPFCKETIELRNSSHVGRHLEEIAFTIINSKYEDWEFYSDTSS